MSRDEEIRILMEDGCAESDAIDHLDRGANIYDDLEENIDAYCEEFSYLDNETDEVRYTDTIREMVKTKVPARDWGIVQDSGKTYYIEYVL